jgi:hypothetical protein
MILGMKFCADNKLLIDLKTQNYFNNKAVKNAEETRKGLMRATQRLTIPPFSEVAAGAVSL